LFTILLAVRVIWTSWAHVWRLRSCFLEPECDKHTAMVYDNEFIWGAHESGNWWNMYSLSLKHTIMAYDNEFIRGTRVFRQVLASRSIITLRLVFLCIMICWLRYPLSPPFIYQGVGLQGRSKLVTIRSWPRIYLYWTNLQYLFIKASRDKGFYSLDSLCPPSSYLSPVGTHDTKPRHIRFEFHFISEKWSISCLWISHSNDVMKSRSMTLTSNFQIHTIQSSYHSSAHGDKRGAPWLSMLETNTGDNDNKMQEHT
jgi:hypothetical protein